MAATPIDEIESWSKKLSPWRQDCLRRLATQNSLTESDFTDLLAIIRDGSKLSQTVTPPTPIPFERKHFSGGNSQPLILKGIAEVQNVNRLQSSASLSFSPNSLTVVYGRNGSGKSGFVRIFRTACRTRIENPAKLKVLANVYDNNSAPQSANIIIDLGNGDVAVPWTPDGEVDARLAPIAVFDSASAQLYVDGGNQIRYLPFGLDLPHRLNSVGMILKERLDAERASAIGNKVSLTAVPFVAARQTAAQSFNQGLNKDTTDQQIDAAARFDDKDQTRLDEITSILSAASTAAADLTALLLWLDSILKESEVAIGALSDEGLAKCTAAKAKASTARQAAEVAATELFTEEPLSGVGSETWRALWAAARDFSVSEAYVDQPFPVTTSDSGIAACVLCQQTLLPEGATRLQRFQAFMDDTLDKSASLAETAVIEALEGLPELTGLSAADFSERLEQLRKRNQAAAEALATFQAVVTKRRVEAFNRLNGEAETSMPVLTSPIALLAELKEKLQAEKNALEKVSDAQEREKFLAEKAELEDRKILATHRSNLSTRRDLMLTDAAYASALAEVQSRAITQRANELVDTHLTAAVGERFNQERTRFEIGHLNIGLTRKSGQTKAEFEVDPQTKVTRLTSEILSEGEQRALALAGFLTEVALTDGSGPIVVDDPVSSLDRDRSEKVAERLAEEAAKRQVIVFTHDMIFFNEICRAADSIDIEPTTIALFSDKSSAGKIDDGGVAWKGLNVSKRIGKIKNSSAPFKKLQMSSPAEYEFQVKNLYGRLRDTYERVIEEVIFSDVVRRGSDVVQTQRLRYVSLSNELAIRFHEGMTKANTHSHDNPASDTVAVPDPEQFQDDIQTLEQLISDFKLESAAAEAARPQMKPKN